MYPTANIEGELKQITRIAFREDGMCELSYDEPTTIRGLDIIQPCFVECKTVDVLQVLDWSFEE